METLPSDLTKAIKHPLDTDPLREKSKNRVWSVKRMGLTGGKRRGRFRRDTRRS